MEIAKAPGKDREAEFDSAQLIVELESAMLHLKHTMAPLKRHRVDGSMFYPEVVEARIRIWQVCEKTQTFFEHKIDGGKEHEQDWCLNFQHIYVQFCTTIHMVPDEQLAKFKAFKDYLRHQRKYIWGYIG